MRCFLLIFAQDEIIITGLVKMPSSSLFLEFLTAHAVQAALPSAGGKLGGRDSLGCPWKTEAMLFLQPVLFSFHRRMKGSVGGERCCALSLAMQGDGLMSVFSLSCKIFLSQIPHLT